MATCANPITVNYQQHTLVRGLEQLYSERVLCDVTLRAEKETVDVHKCVLAATSPYFRAMFTLQTCESSQKTVELHNIAGCALVDVIKFIYTGDVIVNESNVQALITAANMLQIEALVQYCEDFMCSALCTENCLEVYTFADFQNFEKLQKVAESFILDHFTDIVGTDAFLHLNQKTLSKIFSSDELNVPSEEIIYEAILKWLHHDLDNRKKDLILLLLCLRFPLMNQSFIKNTIANEKLITENAFCSQLISNALALTSVETSQGNCNSKPRLGMYSTNMIIFSGGAYSPTDRAFCCFSPDTKKSFYAIKQHPTFDFKFKIDLYKLIVTESNEIYFLGGVFYDDYHFERDGGEAKDAVLYYNKKESIWQPCPPMKTPRCGFGACSYGNKLYVFGGYRKYPRHPPLQEVAAYDTDLMTWSLCDEMPIEIAHQAATVYRDTALLFGGMDASDQYLETVLQYSFTKDQWTLIDTELLSPSAEATAVTLDDKIYVLGGQNHAGGITTVAVFNPETHRWKYCQEFPEVRKFTSVTKGEDCIYVCGGVRQVISRSVTGRRSKTVETKDLYKYDIANDKWSKEARFIEYGSNYACAYATVNTKLLTASEFVAAP